MNQPNTQRPSGFSCPACKSFIPVSMMDLVSKQVITCPICSLQLAINQEESKKAIDAVEKVKDAQEKVNKASVFRK